MKMWAYLIIGKYEHNASIQGNFSLDSETALSILSNCLLKPKQEH